MFAKLNNPNSLFLKFSLCFWLLCVHSQLPEEALFPDGESCTTNFDCESGYCTSNTGICATDLEGYLSLGPGICQNSDGSQAEALYKHQQGDICEEMCTDDDTCTGYSVSLYNNCMLFFSPSFVPLIGGGPSWGDSQCIIKNLQELSTTVEPSMKHSGLPSTSPSFEQPSISPSYAPSFSPSSTPTVAPSLEQSSKTTLSDPTGFHYASCGNQNSGCNETYVKEDSALLGVRCASDHMISEWREDACGATGSTIWYESDVWDEGCQILNFQIASEFCAKVGGRLPTLQEVQGDCLKGSGCGHNYRQIWTSDMAPEPEVSTTLEASVKPSASPSFTLRSSTPSFPPSLNPSFTPTLTPSFEPTSKPTFTESSAKEELDLEASIFASSTVLTEENRMKVNASLTEPASITWFINDEHIDNYPLITAFENELVIVSGGGFEYGSVIDITMSATSIEDPSKRTSESISINVNRPPESGECYCDGVTAFQPLTLLCDGWHDAHLPLTYDFVLETGRGSSLTLTKNQLSPAFTFEAPPGNFTITANIRDSLGARATFPMYVSTALPSNSTLIASALESSQLTLKEASEFGDVSTFASSVALIDLTLGAVEREHYDHHRLLDGSNVRSEMYGTFRELAEQIFSDDDLLQLAQILNAIFSNKLQVEPNVLNDAINSVNDIRSKSNILTKNAADPLLEVLSTFSSSIFEDVSAHDTVALVQSIENSMHGTFRDAIRQFISGETYEVHFDEMSGSALRMSTSDKRSLRACGGSSFELPTTFSTEFSGEILDCITISSSNFPEMLVSTPETPLSSPESLTLYTDSEPLLIPQDKFQCDGFIIRHTINNASSIALFDDITASGKYESLALPKCAFFDTTTLEWSSDNCTLLSYDESEMVCQCSHLTTFMGVLESFEPDINSLEKETWQQFTLANIFARPTPLILCISVVLSIALLYLIIGEKTNRPLIASKECLPKERRSELFGQSPEGKIHRLLNKDSNACAKVWSLYKLKMRNEHIFFSMWTRQGHTNYSTKFRLLFFMVYLFTILLGSAIFYGQDQQHAASELLWIVIVAVIGGGLVWLMQKVIKSSRPRFPIEELIAKDMSFIEEHGKTMTILNTDSFLEMDTVSLATQKRFVSETFEKMLSLSSLDDLIIEGTVSLELESKRVPSKIKKTGPRDVSDCHGGAIFQVMSQSEFSEFLFTDEDQSDVSLGPRDVSLRSVSDMIRDRINSTDLMSPTTEEDLELSGKFVTVKVLDSPRATLALQPSFHASLEKMDTFYSLGALMGENSETVEKKLRRHYNLRQTILKEKYPLAHHWRMKVLMFCAIYCLMASIFIMLFGLQFELEFKANDSACGVASVEERINQAASAHWTQNSNIWPSYSLPTTWSTTERWLFSNLLAVIETLLFINPIRMFVTILIQVFLFDPFVSMLLFLRRHGFLCICCCFRFSDAWIAAKKLTREASESKSTESISGSFGSALRLMTIRDPVNRFFTSSSDSTLSKSSSSSMELALVE